MQLKIQNFWPKKFFQQLLEFALKSNLPDFSGAAGAAFLLHAPAKKSIVLQHPVAVVSVRQNASYVTVALNTLQDPSLAKIKSAAWRIIQEAFDSYAATHHVALSTKHGYREYFLWIHTNDGYQLTCVYTLAPELIAEIKAENHVSQFAPISIPFITHPSLRYYRKSLLTDDLYDAYRNAYLCLECLVSDESPRQINSKGKGKEAEKDWLKRVLGGTLSVALPGLNINTFVEDIYNGRLQVFHAKVSESFYPPYCEEREEIQYLLNTLSMWLNNLLRYKFGNCVSGREVSYSQTVEDAMNRVLFQFDRMTFKHHFLHKPATTVIELIEQPRRFGQLWAKVKSNTKPNLDYFGGIEFFRGKESWFWITFGENIPLTNVCTIIFEFNVLTSSDSVTVPLHPT